MRKLVSYLGSGVFALMLLVTLFNPIVFARDPGQAGAPDNDDANAMQLYCESKHPGTTQAQLEQVNQCFLIMSLVVSQAWDNMDEVVTNCSDLSSNAFEACNTAVSDGAVRNAVNPYGTELAIFVNKLSPYYSTDNTPATGDVDDLTIDNVKVPFTDTQGSRQAQAKLDQSPAVKENILNNCRTNPDNAGKPASYVIDCISCASIAYGFGLPDVEAASCQAQISQVVNPALGKISLGGSDNGSFCLNTCGQYNDRVGGIGNAEEVAATIDAKGAGVQAKFDLPGITCGSVNNPPYDRCCRPTTVQVSCAIQDLKVVNYPSAKSWFNPINWAGNVVKSGGTLAQNASISTLCSIFKDQLGRRVEKVDSAIFQNDKIPEISSTVSESGYCIPDSNRPNIEAVIDPSLQPTDDGYCTCKDPTVPQISENFGENLCNRIAPNNKDACLACATIALTADMNCSSDALDDEGKARCNSCTSEQYYVDNAQLFASMADLGDQGRKFCQGVPNGEYRDCVACMLPSVYGVSGFWTSFGCMQTNPTAFISQTVIPVGISLGAAAAFMTILYSAYLIQTSQGNPEKLKKARAYLNTSLIGLMLIIFAALILQIIGIDILRIPGLG